MIVLSLSLFTLVSVVTARAIDNPREAELRARYQACDANPYRCIPPTVTFASLR
ncbi:hypothetical protein [Pseudomonas sp. B392_1p]|uniref:hypothetical protein n=1 Tax=Pseudomonas sp. B392_1p TaxID=3457507 RepID=UPI003FD19739